VSESVNREDLTLSGKGKLDLGGVNQSCMGESKREVKSIQHFFIPTQSSLIDLLSIHSHHRYSFNKIGRTIFF